MGFFEKMQKSFNGGRQRAIDNSYRRRKENEDLPIELVQPNEGKFVTLKIKEVDEIFKSICIRQLITYAKVTKNIYPDTVITTGSDRITLEMSSEEKAKSIRDHWENRLQKS